jgi:hypothetical protein
MSLVLLHSAHHAGHGIGPEVFGRVAAERQRHVRIGDQVAAGDVDLQGGVRAEGRLGAVAGE